MQMFFTVNSLSGLQGGGLRGVGWGMKAGVREREEWFPEVEKTNLSSFFN